MLKKNILITGGYGYLGTAFIKELVNSKNFNIFLPSDRIELLSKENFKPDVIVHIAYKNIGYKGNIVEENLKDLKHLTNLKINNNTHFIFISSDYVFKEDGLKEYNEKDLCCPDTDYGNSKVVCENYIKENFSHTTILRTSMLYGYYNKNRDNFVRFVFDKLIKNEEINVYKNVFCRPTHVKDLSNFMLECINQNIYGIFHATSEHLVNRVDIAEQICLQNKFDINLIRPIEKEKEVVFPASINLIPSKEFLIKNKHSIYKDFNMLGDNND